MNPGVYYVWVGGSCDYTDERRVGAAAYIIEKENLKICDYVVADFNTTEFRMILNVMIHAMTILPEKSQIVFVSNVAYIQNYNKVPQPNTANSDLIKQCLALKERHTSCNVKIVPYHKFSQLQETHDVAHRQMIKLRV